MDENFQEIARESEKSTPNLWQPEPTFYENSKEELKIQKVLVKKIAGVMAKKIGLSERDFVIRFWIDDNYEKKVAIRAGVIVRIYFSVLMQDPEFEDILERALKHAKLVKRAKDIELWHVLDDRKKWTTKLTPNIKQDIPREETEVTVEYRVSVKHKETGIVSIRTGLVSTNTVTRLTALAREELIDMVEAARPLLKPKLEKMTVKQVFDSFDTEVQCEEVYSQVDMSDAALNITEYDDKI